MEQYTNEVIQQYYSTMRAVLTTLCEVIVERETSLDFDLNLLQGRAGSSYFEESFMKPLLRKHKSHFSNKVNSNLRDLGITKYYYLDVHASENKDESDERKMADVTILLMSSYGEIKVPINIKASAGKTADNIGGWQSLDWALFGNEGKPAKTRAKVMSKISKQPISEELYDYFLWVFDKSYSTPKEILESSQVHSFFSTSLESFVFNANQSFPVQFRCHSAQHIEDWSEGILVVKKQFSNKIAEEYIKHAKKLLDDAYSMVVDMPEEENAF